MMKCNPRVPNGMTSLVTLKEILCVMFALMRKYERERGVCEVRPWALQETAGEDNDYSLDAKSCKDSLAQICKWKMFPFMHQMSSCIALVSKHVEYVMFLFIVAILDWECANDP